MLWMRLQRIHSIAWRWNTKKTPYDSQDDGARFSHDELLTEARLRNIISVPPDASDYEILEQIRMRTPSEVWFRAQENNNQRLKDFVSDELNVLYCEQKAKDPRFVKAVNCWHRLPSLERPCILFAAGLDEEFCSRALQAYFSEPQDAAWWIHP